MNNSEQHMTHTEVAHLLNELVYRRYFFNKNQIIRFLNKLSNSEYIALHIIRKTEEEESDDIYSGRTYLKDLADRMQLPIRHISKMVDNLKDRGFLVWSHDGDGSEGTYVTLTDSGRNQLANEEKNLKTYYGKVIEKFGKENLIKMLQLMKQFDTVMSAESEVREENAHDGN